MFGPIPHRRNHRRYFRGDPFSLSPRMADLSHRGPHKPQVKNTYCNTSWMVTTTETRCAFVSAAQWRQEALLATKRHRLRPRTRPPRVEICSTGPDWSDKSCALPARGGTRSTAAIRCAAREGWPLRRSRPAGGIGRNRFRREKYQDFNVFVIFSPEQKYHTVNTSSP